MKLILIRHGETDYNAENKYCGFSNPSLNKKGIEQARKLYRDFKKESAGAIRELPAKIDRVYSSDLQRAYQTAKIVFPELEVEIKQNFREMNFGLFEGLKYNEITQKYPEIYQNWLKNPLETEIPQGESLKALAKRVRGELKELLSENIGKTVALVTHGGPIRVIILDKQKRDLKNFWNIYPVRKKIGVQPFLSSRTEFSNGVIQDLGIICIMKYNYKRAGAPLARARNL